MIKYNYKSGTNFGLSNNKTRVAFNIPGLDNS